MKIAVLIDRFNVGGVEKIALEQVAALRKIGINADLIVLTKKAVVVDAFLELQKKVPIIYLDQRLPAFLRTSIKFPVFHFFSFFHVLYPILLPFVMKRKEYDYIICHGTFTCFSAITFKYFSGISYSAFIWDPIGYILDKVYRNSFNPFIFKVLIGCARLLDGLIAKTSDEILVGGKAHNTYFQSLSTNVKITVIPPSVHPVLKMIESKREGVLLLTAWKRGKNPEYIFNILDKMPNIKVTLVGKWLDEEYRAEFEAEVKQRKYTKNITVIGAVSEGELSHYYSHARVFLQINDDRGFGMPALEAAAHGTPFIIPRGQGVCELFNDGVHGFYTKEKDLKQIVTGLNLLLTDTKKATQMGKACYTIVKDTYSWQAHAHDLVNVYKRNS